MLFNNRFVRLEGSFCGGMKVFSRKEVNLALNSDNAYDMIYFLRKLWTAYGKPKYIDNGFSYCIKDNLLNVEFEVYSGASGPSYGGDRDFYVDFENGILKNEVMDSIKTFDSWVETLALSNNYEIEYYIDEEHQINGKNIEVVGMKDGVEYKFYK